MENMIFTAQEGILLKKFQGNLSSYTQTNCQVTLTDGGYRIYRPPNLTTANNGNTMWGGFILRFTTPPFIKGHTYIIGFNVKGQTSNAAEVSWSNQCGWGGGGLMPSPSSVIHNAPTANFESDNWRYFFYQWTINDDVYKTCTSAYSSFVQGNVYPSYRDFKFGFSYTSTGTLGTDLYINNLRMYDITLEPKVSINKQGQIRPGQVIEENLNLANVKRNLDIGCQNFYEY